MVKRDEKKKFSIYINISSGTAQSLGEQALRAKIKQSPLKDSHLYLLEGETFFKTIKEISKKDTPILIGGGDGTIKSAAEILMEKQISFGVLPFGTMNLLAQDLNVPLKLEDALEAYAAQTYHKKIDVGYVNDAVFLCCAGLGTMPETSVYREAHRGENNAVMMPQLMAYMMDEMDKMARRHLKIRIDNKRRPLRTSCLVISNNTYSDTAEWTQNSFKRHRLQDGILGVYAAKPRSFWQKIGFLLRLKIGGWQKDPVIKSWTGKKVVINSHRKKELVSLDGEAVELQTPLKFSLQNKKLKVLLPKMPKEKAA
jgi:diacylglycerol kinase family enzyme